MKTKNYILLCFLLLPFFVMGQGMSMSDRVSVSFKGLSLEEALVHLSETCELKFAYSADKIPVDQPINLDFVDEPLADILDALFAASQIVYARIGNQIVLKIDEKKNPIDIGVSEKGVRLSGREINYKHPEGIYREEMKTDSPLQQQSEILRNERLPSKLPPRALIGGVDYEFEIDYSELDFQGYINLKNYKIPFVKTIKDIDINLEEITGVGDSVSAHVGLVPKVEKRFGKKQKSDNISANLFWGKSDRVEGVQLSGLLNSVVEEIEGVQIAGIGNIVEGNVVGTQIGGVFNYTESETFGLQLALVANIAETMIGSQISLVTNRANSAFTGVQVAGLYNKANRSSSGVQLAALHNKSAGTINTQISLVNKAKRVQGIQIGLINMADTVQGIPIGLLNFIKRGYNRLELAYDTTLPITVGLKLGARSFYNIFQAGTQTDASLWGIGYGLGTYIRVGKRTGLNLELTAMQVSKREAWTNNWNLLGQFRTTLDIRLGKKFSLFVGPSLNLHYSEDFDVETKTFNTTLAPTKPFFEEVAISVPKPNRTQVWIGFRGGLRF